MRIALIGDIGGHAAALHDELTRLGAGRDGSLPEDLLVIQVGDLIHRGPHSGQVVDMVDDYLRTQPGQWIQLIGNHEAHYLQPPVFRWPETLDRRHIRTLKRWWRKRAAVVAAAIDTSEESFLVTHAGITSQFWNAIAGPATAAEAARRINSLAITQPDMVFRAGAFIHGTTVPDVGPLWAETATELLPGWADRRLPFSQIHGHNSITTWRGHDATAPRTAVDALVTVDYAAKHEFVHLEGGRLIGIDPDHRDTPTTPWHAFELTGNLAY